MGFPELTAQLSAWKTIGKDSSAACTIACQNCAVYSVFPSGMTYSKIAQFNPLNPELNPSCYLLALLAHHFLHVSRIRVKSLTLRLLMSYIYIYIWSTYS